MYYTLTGSSHTNFKRFRKRGAYKTFKNHRQSVGNVAIKGTDCASEIKFTAKFSLQYALQLSSKTDHNQHEVRRYCHKTGNNSSRLIAIKERNTKLYNSLSQKARHLIFTKRRNAIAVPIVCLERLRSNSLYG